jgi:hypothetical protein
LGVVRREGPSHWRGGLAVGWLCECEWERCQKAFGVGILEPTAHCISLIARGEGEQMKCVLGVVREEVLDVGAREVERV